MDSNRLNPRGDSSYNSRRLFLLSASGGYPICLSTEKQSGQAPWTTWVPRPLIQPRHDYLSLRYPLLLSLWLSQCCAIFSFLSFFCVPCSHYLWTRGLFHRNVCKCGRPLVVIKYQQNIKRPAKKLYISQYHWRSWIYFGFSARVWRSEAPERRESQGLLSFFALCDSRKGHVYVKFFLNETWEHIKLRRPFKGW